MEHFLTVTAGDHGLACLDGHFRHVVQIFIRPTGIFQPQGGHGDIFETGLADQALWAVPFGIVIVRSAVGAGDQVRLLLHVQRLADIVLALRIGEEGQGRHLDAVTDLRLHNLAAIKALHAFRGFLCMYLVEHQRGGLFRCKIDDARQAAALVWLQPEGQTRGLLRTAIIDVIEREISPEAMDGRGVTLSLSRWRVGADRAIGKYKNATLPGHGMRGHQGIEGWLGTARPCATDNRRVWRVVVKVIMVGGWFSHAFAYPVMAYALCIKSIDSG